MTKTYRLTQEPFRKLTGESLTTAVTVAVRERLEKLKRQTDGGNSWTPLRSLLEPLGRGVLRYPPFQRAVALD